MRRDWTVAHHGQLYQIRDNVRATPVLVEDRVDGTMCITYKGRPLHSHPIAARPVKTAEPPTGYSPRRPVKPMPGHPWQKRLLPERRKPAAAPMT